MWGYEGCASLRTASAAARRRSATALQRCGQRGGREFCRQLRSAMMSDFRSGGLAFGSLGKITISGAIPWI